MALSTSSPREISGGYCPAACPLKSQRPHPQELQLSILSPKAQRLSGLSLKLRLGPESRHPLNETCGDIIFNSKIGFALYLLEKMQKEGTARHLYLILSRTNLSAVTTQLRAPAKRCSFGSAHWDIIFYHIRVSQTTQQKQKEREKSLFFDPLLYLGGPPEHLQLLLCPPR